MEIHTHSHTYTISDTEFQNELELRFKKWVAKIIQKKFNFLYQIRNIKGYRKKRMRRKVFVSSERSPFPPQLNKRDQLTLILQLKKAFIERQVFSTVGRPSRWSNSYLRNVTGMKYTGWFP